MKIIYGEKDLSYEEENGKQGSIMMKFEYDEERGGFHCHVLSEASPMMVMMAIESLNELLEKENKNFVDYLAKEWVIDKNGMGGLGKLLREIMKDLN